MLSTPHSSQWYFTKSDMQVCRPVDYYAFYGTRCPALKDPSADLSSAFGDEPETECKDKLLVAETEGELGSLPVFSEP